MADILTLYEYIKRLGQELNVAVFGFSRGLLAFIHGLSRDTIAMTLSLSGSSIGRLIELKMTDKASWRIVEPIDMIPKYKFAT